MSQDEEFSHTANEEVSEHNQIVRKIERIIEKELGLMKYPKKAPFTSGFIPDILTNIGGTNNGWVIIDIINSQESLVRDIGGLLVCKANAEHAGCGICAVFALATSKVTDEKPVRKFIDTVQDFNLLIGRPKQNDMFFAFSADMRILMWDALTKRLEILNDWYVDSVFYSLACQERFRLEDKIHSGLQMLEARH
jgi:hypothetical protein